MLSYSQKIKVRSSYQSEAKDFFEFLRLAGRGHSPFIKFNYRYLGRGYFAVILTGEGLGIDSLLRELLLNKGLFYYACSIRRNKEEVINTVLVPVFQELLEKRFQNPYTRSLRRHIRGKISSNQSIPGDFLEPFSHEYEVLYSRWGGGMIDDWNFVKNLDGLLTKFMLTKIEHPAGARSPVFHVLVERVYAKGVGMAEEVKGIFNKVHELRTVGLHRLQTKFSREEMSEVSGRLYNYFQFFDEFSASQDKKTEKLHGKLFRRIKYGDEKFLDEKGEPYRNVNGEEFNWDEITQKECHDCAAIKGQYHCMGCDVEQCPRCVGQMISCTCKLQKDYN